MDLLRRFAPEYAVRYEGILFVVSNTRAGLDQTIWSVEHLGQPCSATIIQTFLRYSPGSVCSSDNSYLGLGLVDL